MRELSLYEMNLLCRLMAEDIVDIFEEEEPAQIDDVTFICAVYF